MISQVGDNINAEHTVSYEKAAAVNTDGTRIVIGNAGNRGSTGVSNIGHMRVFEKQVDTTTWTTTWTQLGSDIDGEQSYDCWGTAVAINGAGTRVAMGAPFSTPGLRFGKVVVYEYDVQGATWSSIGSFVGSANGHELGSSVVMDETGDTIAISSPKTGLSGNHGTVDIHTYDSATGTWTKVYTIEGNYNEQLGKKPQSLALNSVGDVLVVGAPGQGTGFVAVYKKDAGTWGQLGPSIVPTTSSNAQAGWAVDVNGDGTRIIIGAPRDDVASKGSYSIYDYDPNTFTWTQVTKVEGNMNQQLGHSVAMDDSGTRAIVGAHVTATSLTHGYVRLIEQDTASGAWSTIKEYTGIDSSETGRPVVMSADGDTYAFSSKIVAGWVGGATQVYDIWGTSAQDLKMLVDGTSIDPTTVDVANAAINHGITATSADAAATVQTALDAFKDDPNFNNTSGADKRGIMKHVTRQAVERKQGTITLPKSYFTAFMGTPDDIKDDILLAQVGNNNVSVDTSATTFHCPFDDLESSTFTDTSTGTSRVFVMSKSTSGYNLTVDGDPKVTDGQAEVVYTITDGAYTTTVTFSSGTVSTTLTSGVASGDPYLATML